jgi:hypothetical protein
MSWRCTPWLAVLGGLWAGCVQGDDFSAGYDSRTDELVVNVIYRGTNPNHTFTLKWGSCHSSGQGSGNDQIVVNILDNQWNDSALNDYARTVRFSLNGLQCRPAQVTVRMAPHFYSVLSIPAAPASQP